MNKKKIGEWKKVFESDLEHLTNEFKDLVASPAVLILSGDLGAGKTTFTKAFFQSDLVASPTYSVLSEVKNALHGDLYRLSSPQELTELELELYLEDKDFFFVEWGEEFAHDIYKHTPEKFSYFLLDILNQDSSHDEDCRKYTLYELSFEY